MIFFQRRRLLLWLLRAYVKKWKKTIFIFFTLGAVSFFILYLSFRFFQPTLLTQKQSIGLVGAYTVNSLPYSILDKLSFGLTSVLENGIPSPKAAASWSVSDNGKTYTFFLKDNLRFNDGRNFTSSDVNYNFENVKVERPSKYKIIFKLNNSYSPFLITVSKPIFRKNFVGMGDYVFRNIDLNGDFVDSITMSSGKNTIAYQFYPTEESLKLGLLMGEVDESNDISDLSILGDNLLRFKNFKVNKRVNYDKLVTLFYDTQNRSLSDKRLREALNYALPDNFSQGKRSHTPYPPLIWVSQENTLTYNQDFEHAKSLLQESGSSQSAQLVFTLKTLPKYKLVAQEIKKVWENLGVKTNIETVNSLPTSFDMFLGEFYVSKDPDQYVLWHSDQASNITRYKNLRIDKLLEDGRQVTDTNERRKIYSDFQKYLLDDPPASFLFFPYFYSITK